ncbi:hypothetical protein LY78DRAFT_117809 [Colletotrichum sublineola]|nr:hypothetical protein LY78DRAFT_117809 [Colletotrichum sublineola]
MRQQYYMMASSNRKTQRLLLNGMRPQPAVSCTPLWYTCHSRQVSCPKMGATEEYASSQSISGKPRREPELGFSPGCLACEHRDDMLSATTKGLLTSRQGGQAPVQNPKVNHFVRQQRPPFRLPTWYLWAFACIMHTAHTQKSNKGELDVWLVLARVDAGNRPSRQSHLDQEVCHQPGSSEIETHTPTEGERESEQMCVCVCVCVNELAVPHLSTPPQPAFSACFRFGVEPMCSFSLGLMSMCLRTWGRSLEQCCIRASLAEFAGLHKRWIGRHVPSPARSEWSSECDARAPWW